MIDIICLAVVGVVVWFVASEGIWGAVQVFLCTLLAGLVAMNFFEPLAGQLRAFVPDKYCDIVALLGLFTGLTFALRMGAEYLSPSYIQVFPMLDTAGRWVAGAATGYLTMAFLLTALHTAPLPREFMGFQAERPNFFGTFPDRQWLGFVQYVSAKPLAVLVRDKIGDKEFVVAWHSFDGKYEKVGDPANPYATPDSSGRLTPQLIWPSFPIRYAMRRAQAGGGSAAAAAPAIQVVPQIVPPGGAGAQPGGPGF